MAFVTLWKSYIHQITVLNNNLCAQLDLATTVELSYKIILKQKGYLMVPLEEENRPLLWRENIVWMPVRGNINLLMICSYLFLEHSNSTLATTSIFIFGSNKIRTQDLPSPSPQFNVLPTELSWLDVSLSENLTQYICLKPTYFLFHILAVVAWLVERLLQKKCHLSTVVQIPLRLSMVKYSR